MSSEIQTYTNVMEHFVTEEIEYQLKKNSTLHKMADSVNKLEIATFALNRLPCYYASCLEGIERQRRRIKEQRQLRKKITQVVSQAFAAVENNPLRLATPIPAEPKDRIEQAKDTLPKLADSLPHIELTWIVSFMETFLTNLKNEQVSHQEVVKLYYLLYHYWRDSQ
jgi:hypothetical protein